MKELLTNRVPVVSPLMLAFMLLPACDLFTAPREPTVSWAKVPLDQRVTDAYTDFSFELFRRLQAADADGNVFASGTSAAFALAMTYNGAVGQTREEMANTLRIGGLDQATVNATNKLWLEALRDTGDPAAELAVANSVWFRPTYPIMNSFRERVRAYYGAEIEPITTAQAINSWVDNATRGRIDEI
jgi:serine protease inhibitor